MNKISTSWIGLSCSLPPTSVYLCVMNNVWLTGETLTKVHVLLNHLLAGGLRRCRIHGGAYIVRQDNAKQFECLCMFRFWHAWLERVSAFSSFHTVIARDLCLGAWLPLYCSAAKHDKHQPELCRNTETHTLSAHNLSNMLGAGNRDAFGHVDALFPGLLVVVQGVFVVV